MHSGSTLLAIGSSHAYYVQFTLNSVSEEHKDACNLPVNQNKLNDNDCLV